MARGGEGAAEKVYARACLQGVKASEALKLLECGSMARARELSQTEVGTKLTSTASHASASFLAHGSRALIC